MRMTLLTLCVVGILLYVNGASLNGLGSRIETVEQRALVMICPPADASLICHFIVELIDR